MEVTTTRLRAKDVAVAVALLVFALAMLKDTRVPLLSLVDLGFHELGHLVTYPFPDLVTAMAGSINQVAVPLGLAVYFFAVQGDRAGAGLCLGWAATSAQDAARYIADAPFERLQLIGGEHDWAFVFDRIGHMEWAGAVAMAVRVSSWTMLAGAVALVAWRYVRPATTYDFREPG